MSLVADTSLPADVRRDFSFAEDGVVEVVGRDSREVGVPTNEVEDDDSRFSGISSPNDLSLPRGGTAGSSSAMSIQVLSGELDSGSDVTLCLPDGLSDIFDFGVPGRLDGPTADILALLLFLGVPPRPSSLRRASAVSRSTSHPCLPDLSAPLSDRARRVVEGEK
jgi:hypothetical protein